MGHDDHDDHRRSGPEGTEFLDLELTRVIAAEARSLTREGVRELLREAIQERLRERLGDRLREVGRIAADELADDIELNLDVERRIDERRARAKELDERLRAAFRGERRD